MLDLRRVDGTAQVVADDKACAVTVREHDDAARLGQTAQQRQSLPVVEDAETGGLENGRVDDLREGVFIIPPLDDDGLADADHTAPPTAMRSSSSLSSAISSAPLLFMAKSACAHRRTASSS